MTRRDFLKALSVLGSLILSMNCRLKIRIPEGISDISAVLKISFLIRLSISLR